MMKKILWFLMLAAGFVFVACSDDDEFTPPTLEVTPNNIAGIWELHEWSGTEGKAPVVYDSIFELMN